MASALTSSMGNLADMTGNMGNAGNMTSSSSGWGSPSSMTSGGGSSTTGFGNGGNSSTSGFGNMGGFTTGNNGGNSTTSTGFGNIPTGFTSGGNGWSTNTSYPSSSTNSSTSGGTTTTMPTNPFDLNSYGLNTTNNGSSRSLDMANLQFSNIAGPKALIKEANTGKTIEVPANGEAKLQMPVSGDDLAFTAATESGEVLQINGGPTGQMNKTDAVPEVQKVFVIHKPSKTYNVLLGT